MAEDFMLDNQTRIKVHGHLSQYNAADLMKPVEEKIGPDDNLSDIISAMNRCHIGELPVMQGYKLLGVVSRSFILKRKDLPLSTKAKTIMVNHPQLSPDSTIIEIADRFISTNARQLYVYDNGKMQGVVSREDVVNVIPKIPELSRLKTIDLMCDDPVFVYEKDTVSKAVEIMNELDTPVIPVVDKNMKIQGVVGMMNLVDMAKTPPEGRTTVGDRIGKSLSSKIEVGNIMKRPPISVDNQSRVTDAINTMLNNYISTVIVVGEGNHTDGILTIYDLLHMLASLQEREQVYVQISGLTGEDSYYLDEVYKEIEDFLDRIKGIVSLHGIDLHFDVYHKGGENKKFSIRFRVMTDRGAYHSKSTEWSASLATSEATRHLERLIKSDKEIRQSRRLTRRG